MLKSVEVYIVKPFPKLQICQIPSLSIDIEYLTSEENDNQNFKYDKLFYDWQITKDYIEELFIRFQYKNLIILKTTSDYVKYCLIDMSMSELLEEANKARKFQEMKAFW